MFSAARRCNSPATVVLLGLIALHSCSRTVTATPILPDGPGAWFGSAFEVHTESVAVYLGRVGISPAILNIFVPLPLDANATAYLRLAIPQINAVKAAVMITATPVYGLAAVTEAAVTELAFFISQAEQVWPHSGLAFHTEHLASRCMHLFHPTLCQLKHGCRINKTYCTWCPLMARAARVSPVTCGVGAGWLACHGAICARDERQLVPLGPVPPGICRQLPPGHQHPAGPDLQCSHGLGTQCGVGLPMALW